MSMEDYITGGTDESSRRKSEVAMEDYIESVYISRNPAASRIVLRLGLEKLQRDNRGVEGAPFSTLKRVIDRIVKRGKKGNRTWYYSTLASICAVTNSLCVEMCMESVSGDIFASNEDATAAGAEKRRRKDQDTALQRGNHRQWLAGVDCLGHVLEMCLKLRRPKFAAVVESKSSNEGDDIVFHGSFRRFMRSQPISASLLEHILERYHGGLELYLPPRFEFCLVRAALDDSICTKLPSQRLLLHWFRRSLSYRTKRLVQKSLRSVRVAGVDGGASVTTHRGSSSNTSAVATISLPSPAQWVTTRFIQCAGLSSDSYDGSDGGTAAIDDATSKREEGGDIATLMETSHFQASVMNFVDATISVAYATRQKMGCVRDDGIESRKSGGAQWLAACWSSLVNALAGGAGQSSLAAMLPLQYMIRALLSHIVVDETNDNAGKWRDAISDCLCERFVRGACTFSESGYHDVLEHGRPFLFAVAQAEPHSLDTHDDDDNNIGAQHVAYTRMAAILMLVSTTVNRDLISWKIPTPTTSDTRAGGREYRGSNTTPSFSRVGTFMDGLTESTSRHHAHVRRDRRSSGKVVSSTKLKKSRSIRDLMAHIIRTDASDALVEFCSRLRIMDYYRENPGRYGELVAETVLKAQKDDSGLRDVFRWSSQSRLLDARGGL